MSRAAFLFIDYLKSVVDPMVTPDSISFHPGDWAPEGTDNSFATYKYIPNKDYQQPYINLDNLQVKLHHTSYMKLKDMTAKILRLCNHENPWQNQAIMALGDAEDIRFQDIVVRVATSDQNSFVESTEYFYDVLDILLQYVETPEEGNLTAFIEGA